MHLFGDSTIRQYFEHFMKVAPGKQNYFTFVTPFYLGIKDGIEKQKCFLLKCVVLLSTAVPHITTHHDLFSSLHSFLATQRFVGLV